MYAKFSLESDFTGPYAANCRNLEDCNDLTNQIGGFPMPHFSRKIVTHRNSWLLSKIKNSANAMSNETVN